MTASSPPASPAVRFYGLDLIRLASFAAIAWFHITLIHYNTPDIAIADNSGILGIIEVFTRALSFSGFTICFLTSLLTALSGNSPWRRLRLFAFLLVGWLVFSALMFTPNGEWLVWDIYPLLFAGLAIASAIEIVSLRALRYVGLFGFVLLWIPFWKFGELLPMSSTARAVLGFADCQFEVVEWPILPWAGLVWFGYWCGQGIRQVAVRGREALVMHRGEFVVWATLLVAGTSQWGAFYGIRLGQFFSCEAYRMEPVIFWGHFVWPLFLIRLALEPRIQAKLASFSWARFVSRMSISRRFWLAYFLNYLLAHALSLIVTASGVEETGWNVPTIVVIAIVLLPLTEGITRGGEFLLKLASHVLATARGQGPTDPILPASQPRDIH